MDKKEIPDIDILTELFDLDTFMGVLIRKSTGTPITSVHKSSGYVNVTIGRLIFKAHRIIWAIYNGVVPDPECDIDHLNGIRCDNRPCNLRLVSASSNMKNSKQYKHNTSGITGVSWEKTHKKWRASINIGKKRVNLGRFDDVSDAIRARRKAEVENGYTDRHGK